MSIVLVGSTSGSVTLQEPAVAGSTVLTLPAVSGTVLTTGSSGQSIPKAALPTGSVLQVVQGTTTTRTTSTTSAFANTAITTSITPTSATSKILVIVYCGQCDKNAADTQLDLRIQRSSTNIFDASALNQGLSTALSTNITLSYLDSPATTSSTTYTIQLSNRNNAGTVAVNGNGTATITLMEIAA